MSSIENFAWIHLNQYVNSKDYFSELAKDLHLHKNRGNFSYLNVSFDKFKHSYDARNWLSRKIIAIPCAIGNLLVLTVEILAVPILAIIGSDWTRVLEQSYTCIRTLEVCASHLITLVNDSFGQYVYWNAIAHKKLYENSLSYQERYNQFKEKLESQHLQYNHMHNSSYYNFLLDDIDLFKTMMKTASDEEVVTYYKKAGNRIRSDLDIGNKLLEKDIDLFRWLPDELRNNDEVAERAYSQCTRNIRYASLAFQRSKGYDPVSFAQDSISSLASLVTGSFCLTPDPDAKKSDSFILNIKVIASNANRNKIDFVAKYPIQIKDNAIIVFSQDRAQQIEYKGFSGVLNKLYSDVFQDSFGSRSFIKSKKHHSWLLPVNDPHKLTDTDIYKIFNKKIGKKPENKLYKFSRKNLGETSSKYVKVDADGTEILDYVHGSFGAAGKGAYTRYKTATNKDHSIVVGQSIDPLRASSRAPMDFVLRCKRAEKTKKLPFVVLEPRHLYSDKDPLNEKMVYLAPKKNYDVMGFCKNVLKNKKSRDRNTISKKMMQVFKGMVEAVKELHALDYIHGDVKPNNFLVELDSLESQMDPSVFLCDFEGVKHKDKGSISEVYTSYYLPIEQGDSHVKLYLKAKKLGKKGAFEFGKKLDAFALIKSFSMLSKCIDYDRDQMPPLMKNTFDYYKSIVSECEKLNHSTLNLTGRISDIVPDIDVLLEGKGNILGINQLLNLV